jgi:hypothetical protein
VTFVLPHGAIAAEHKHEGICDGTASQGLLSSGCLQNV